MDMMPISDVKNIRLDIRRESLSDSVLLKCMEQRRKVEAATLNYDLMESVIARKEGIMDGVKEYVSNVEFVADATAGDQEEGMTNTENFLQANPDLKVVCGVSDGAALGAYQAFKAQGMTDPDKYLIAGIDATDEALN